MNGLERTLLDITWALALWLAFDLLLWLALWQVRKLATELTELHSQWVAVRQRERMRRASRCAR